MKIRGTKPKIHIIPEATEKLKNIYDISGAKLVSFMSGSVATRLQEPEFWISLDKLKITMI